MRTWTNEELKTLTSNYGKVSNEELEKLLPNKSRIAIYKRAYNLGMRQSKEMNSINRSNARRGEKSSNWKGGCYVTSKGYKLVRKPNHHRADSNGYVLEHILVFEEKTGVQVPDNCCVHHLNGNKTDNRIENLCLMLTSAHTVHHNTGRVQTEETKRKISVKSKERLKDKTKHPAYKDIDINAMKRMRDSGNTVSDICKEFGICKYTYYKKMEELK